MTLHDIYSYSWLLYCRFDERNLSQNAINLHFVHNDSEYSFYTNGARYLFT